MHILLKDRPNLFAIIFIQVSRGCNDIIESSLCLRVELSMTPQSTYAESMPTLDDEMDSDIWSAEALGFQLSQRYGEGKM